ncbi:hypothetical protein fugu_014196 [Takifugu bimaculatus]|uniref:Uncharacterized protein n=1 Tax=Takifugu bimaculatus TaxID=433685 RepID=A0A4Z2C2M9_9TELE|nr:hypothetical protein fugu_014196 [Takifugu bimaculatus]
MVQSLWTQVEPGRTSIDSDLEGKKVLLRLHAQARPELSLECELSHSLPTLQILPQHSRVKLTARTGNQRYETEALVQMEGCTVRGRGLVESQRGLRGSLVYRNNCSVIQEWAIPDSVTSSGFLAVSSALAESQVSVAIDDTEMQTSVVLRRNKEINEAWFNVSHSVPLLRKVGLPAQAGIRVNSANHGNGSYSYLFNGTAGSQKIYKEISVTKIPETFRLKSRFKHTVNYLKKMGIPANNSVQVELGSAEGKTLTLQSEFGGQQAGVRLKLKCLQVNKEMRGTMWHSWPWLRHRGLPHSAEVTCAVQGMLAQFQSQAQVAVDGRSLLVSGLNVSAPDGRLSLLLSVSPSNQTQPSLATTWVAQIKGPLRSASADVHCHDWRVRMMGDIQGWGAYGGSKEARLTFKHTLHSHASPALQVEAWGRLTDTQLRCSVASEP